MPHAEENDVEKKFRSTSYEKTCRVKLKKLYLPNHTKKITYKMYSLSCSFNLQSKFEMREQAILHTITRIGMMFEQGTPNSFEWQQVRVELDDQPV